MGWVGSRLHLLTLPGSLPEGCAALTLLECSHAERYGDVWACDNAYLLLHRQLRPSFGRSKAAVGTASIVDFMDLRRNSRVRPIRRGMWCGVLALPRPDPEQRDTTMPPPGRSR
jgi:hypothetical protein